jgi:glyceraldehyde-3-phosphate dehydrogenase (NADP+) (phosphorylating)
VAINGFGRIGRNFLRCWHGHKRSPLEVVAVNDIIGVENAAHLLKYDSTHGKFQADVDGVFKAEGNGHKFMKVDGKHISVLSEKDPSQLPWNDLGVDLVIEGTGKFRDRTEAEKHIHAGATKVIITASAKGEGIPTYVMGVNARDYSHDAHDIISNGSGTTNCVAPLLSILDKEFDGIMKGTVTSTHSYTSDQSLLDAIHCDKRRARAAALNIVPASTDISKTISLVLPNLKDKLSGIAMRVPTPTVSMVDLVVHVGRKGITLDDVKRVFKTAAANESLRGILAVCDEPLVSMDFRGSFASVTVDTTLTTVVGEDMIKVVAWYDNEWAYSQRVLDLAHIVQAEWAFATGESSSADLDYANSICIVDSEHAECKIHDT